VSRPLLDVKGSGAISFGSRPRLDYVLDSWTAFRIAWILCVDYGGDWVAWNLVKSRFLESASETKMYMADENVFKHTLLTMIYDYGLIEADEYPQDPHAWAKCIEERRRRAENDRRIKKSPEEYCRSKVRRVVNIRGTLGLCQLLLRTIKRKAAELGIVTLPPRLLNVIRDMREVSREGGEDASSLPNSKGVHHVESPA